MQIPGSVIVITGAASGIGASLARRFAAAGARALVLGDVQTGPLEAFADSLNTAHGGAAGGFEAVAITCDVTREDQIRGLVDRAETAFGRIDLFCSNAGLVRDGDETAADEIWRLNWDVHVMANVWAARAVVPGMLARGGGYFLITASAAGLLSSMPSSSYAVTKHAAVAFAEKLAIDHGDAGLRVSVLCPQAVDTPLMQGRLGKGAALDGVLSPDDVASCVLEALEAAPFLILPHPTVLDYVRRKAADYDGWLRGMRRGRAKLLASQTD